MNYSDQNIQDFLDNNLSTEDYRRFKEQMNTDPVLRNKVQIVKKIYATLNDKKGFELDSRFTAQVMKKAHIEELGSVHFKLWHIFIVLFILIVCINISLYYVDMTTLAEDLKITTDGNTLVEIVKRLNTLLGNIHFDYAIPVVGILVVIILGLLDHFILSPRHKAVSSYR